mmetsp:Transcript_15833/g.39219  ORF Transcript_15833/g.39219 Transcript_15833/m.39219 type:complete len:286 (-) Transcript_15833:28-885(-)|eukprot:CAMPEP_0198315702 /NCGR_PEP_ID=MMETSP1450-20131203/5878_1 /TAXON_ID=753684 ORGANISM="Madagascaria erythrocladiodes, Strain CCMP3234" /NCGR_SAMPLE_ID=MMETSP1450 /ASSEMBLY_ACC=CAM_ASM_001115 /LENGTH=285 /DNA_ID=CAMNT_0044018827 /DNA_START=1401 /DNA_END=2258 /DNA_ORIENTATION=-
MTKVAEQLKRRLGPRQFSSTHRTIATVVLAFALLHYASVVTRSSIKSDKAESNHQMQGWAGDWFSTRKPTACEKVMFDLGSNVGDSLAKFANGQIEGAQRSLESAMGEKPNVSEYCVYGFEGNPKWTETLQNEAIRLNNSFKEILVLTETLASDSDGTATLYLDTVNNGKNNWGSSMIKEHRDAVRSGQTGVELRSVDFSAFVEKHTLPRGSPDRNVIIRMDIEGAESSVLDRLIDQGVLCSRVDYIWVEWHRSSMPESGQKAYDEKVRKFKETIADIECETSFI